MRTARASKQILVEYRRALEIVADHLEMIALALQGMEREQSNEKVAPGSTAGSPRHSQSDSLKNQLVASCCNQKLLLAAAIAEPTLWHAQFQPTENTKITGHIAVLELTLHNIKMGIFRIRGDEPDPDSYLAKVSQDYIPLHNALMHSLLSLGIGLDASTEFPDSKISELRCRLKGFEEKAFGKVAFNMATGTAGDNKHVMNFCHFITSLRKIVEAIIGLADNHSQIILCESLGL
eukprot:TRINITY_DN17170_c0_g2_i3.p2 TRINITY_DN17170_c0_g2~~TRINITY_DN17170_c0_g2_i3.p2  ORF type:complete len:235 (-),score=36.09 TRINITY_DN17170_c0_g2_i3:185-889(-)